MPANYPPIAHAGEQLAGMGTPDLEGTFGTFTYYTDDPLDIAHDVPGGRIVPSHPKQRPRDSPGRRPPQYIAARPRGHASRSDRRHRRSAAARFQIADQQFILKQGEWSPWIRVRFPLIEHVAAVHGDVPPLHPATEGGIRIYRSPLNIDPFDPALPISNPSGNSRDIANRIGPFYTQGIEEDTAALRQGVLPYLNISTRAASSKRNTSPAARSLARYREGFSFSISPRSTRIPICSGAGTRRSCSIHTGSRYVPSAT